MNVSSRALITTSDERTWKLDCPVIFLGEWCRLYDQRHKWENMNAIVASPYGLDLTSKILDYEEVRYIERILLSKASVALNNVHGNMYSERFWKIVIGHWLRIFISSGLNRYKTIKKCIVENKISSSTFIKINDERLIPLDFVSYCNLLDDPIGSSTLDYKIINLMSKVDFLIEVIDHSKENFPPIKNNVVLNLHKRGIKQKMFSKVKIFSNYCVRKSDAMISHTYLPQISEIKLNLAVGQCPQFWEIEPLRIVTKADLKLREELKLKFIIENEGELLKILSTIFFDLLPLSYLEGFTELQNLSQYKNFPKSPKFIFTSNDFQSNEVFKVWTAKQTEVHTKYIVGQHGLNYGTDRFQSPHIEVETADIFLAWGEQKPEANYKTSFCFKTLNKKIKSDSNGGLLFIDNPLGYRLDTWDTTMEYHQLFNRKILFLSQIRNTLNPDITVRLHPAKNSTFQAGIRYYKCDPALKIDNGYSKIDLLSARSRLVVYSYESTGVIENFLLDIPTMALFLNGFDHLVGEARAYYHALADVGIFHVSVESATQKIFNEWDSIKAWWDDPVVHRARISFCNQYGRKSRKPIRQLLAILTEEF
jgi:putative transferase (TIGR04331 family)